MNKTNLYDNITGLTEYKITDKINNVINIRNTILNKTLTMFKYDNLPDSLPIIELEKILQLNGKGFITKYNDEIVVLNCNYSDVDVDIYNRPLKVRCFIPNKNDYEVFNITDGVLITNDYLQLGIRNVIDKYSYMINESEITLNIANKWKRSGNIFIANDDNTAESVRTYLKKLNQGEDYFIVSNLLYDSIKIQTDSSNRNTSSELIEYDNYIRSLLYSEIGLFNNSNMKKERLITSEINKSDYIFPLVDNMLECRKKFIDELNKKYNLDCEVDFNSSWKNRENKDNENNKEIDTENIEIDRGDDDVVERIEK